jgi:hypothetical protein
MEVDRSRSERRQVSRTYHFWRREPSGQLRGRRYAGTPTEGLLEQVDVISGVSGGTLPAVYYGLGPQAGAFTEPAVRDALGYDFQSSWIRRWFLPQNIFRYWLSDFARSDIMVQVFNNHLYHKATFADLQPRPKILPLPYGCLEVVCRGRLSEASPLIVVTVCSQRPDRHWPQRSIAVLCAESL